MTSTDIDAATLGRSLVERLDVPYLLDALVESVSGDCHVSPPAARQAIRSWSSFSVIHVPAAVKVDVFVAGSDGRR